MGTWADYHDRANILEELSEESAEFSLDEPLLRDILFHVKEEKQGYGGYGLALGKSDSIHI